MLDLPTASSAEDRFWAKVDKDGPGGCWLWTGGLNASGYGQVTRRIDGSSRSYRAHRLAYEYLVGPIAAGLQLDHTCHDSGTCTLAISCHHRRCVNPAHLAPATPADNSARRRGHPMAKTLSFFSFVENYTEITTPQEVGPRGRGRPRKTHCKRGHPLVEFNLEMRSNGQRACLACRILRRPVACRQCGEMVPPFAVVCPTCDEPSPRGIKMPAEQAS